MSNEQAAMVTTYASVIQAVASIAQILVALFAIKLAGKEIRKWRQELLGTKQVELAIRLGKAAYRVQNSFESARSVSGTRTYDTYSAYTNDIEEALRRMQDIKIDASLILSKDDVQAISKQVNTYYAQLVKLKMAIWLKYHPEDAENMSPLLTVMWLLIMALQSTLNRYLTA